MTHSVHWKLLNEITFHDISNHRLIKFRLFFRKFYWKVPNFDMFWVFVFKIFLDKFGFWFCRPQKVFCKSVKISIFWYSFALWCTSRLFKTRPVLDQFHDSSKQLNSVFGFISWFAQFAKYLVGKKAERACQKPRKCTKSWKMCKKLGKCAKSYESMRKCAKIWESVPIAEKLQQSVL